VSEHTLDELLRLDFGLGHGVVVTSVDRPPLIGGAGGPGDDAGQADSTHHDPQGRARSAVLPLADLLEMALAAARPLRVLVETKHPNRFGGEVEYRLVRLLDRYGLLANETPHPLDVTVMSFSPWALGRIRSLAPRLDTVMLLERRVPGLSGGRLPFGSTIAGPGIDLVRRHPELVRRFIARGNAVYVWTVNTVADVDLVVDLGVSGLITDRPGLVRDRLAARFD